ncbi:MAG: hypothetical protein AVDCRST_MAG93-5474, partial [uncultured Chloroflexia bacterium]
MSETPTTNRFTVDDRISTVCFVYPFLDGEHNRFAERVAAVNACSWSDEAGAAPLWRTKNYSEVDDLLPYVANYLAPMARGSEATSTDATPTAQFWTLNMREQADGKKRFAAPRAEGMLEVVGRSSGTVEHQWMFNVDEIQLALFGHGVGFLAFWVTPRNAPYIEDWMSFVHHFRTPVGRGGRHTTITMWRLPSHSSRTRYALCPP